MATQSWIVALFHGLIVRLAGGASLKKSVLAIGFELPEVEGFETARITDSRSLLDADIIAVELSLREFGTSYEKYAGVTLLSDYGSASFRTARQYWSSHVSNAFKNGKTVVFFLTEKIDRYYYTGTKEVSGTGRSARTTNHVDKCSNYDFLPFKLGNPIFGRGHSMVLDSSGELVSPFWKEFGHLMAYNCAFQAEGFQPLLRTKSRDHVVGAVMRSQGAILLMPEIDWSSIEIYKLDGDRDKIVGWSDDGFKLSRRLRDSLLAIHASLAGDREETPPPAWTTTVTFRMDIESELEAKIAAVASQIEELTDKKDQLRTELAQAGFLRRLLFSKGHELEDAVRNALIALGFDAKNFKHEDSEFDALFVGPEGRFLGEVEGKDSKPLNVDKISQLQRNLIEDLSRDEVEAMAVGVLFGNAFRLLPLEERGEFFTDKVLQVAKITNIALVKTPDLFHVAKYVIETNNMAFAAQCRTAIASQIGGVVSFPPLPICDGTAPKMMVAKKQGIKRVSPN